MVEYENLQPPKMLDKHRVFFNGKMYVSMEYASKLCGVSKETIRQRAIKNNWKKIKLSRTFYYIADVLKSAGLME